MDPLSIFLVGYFGTTFNFNFEILKKKYLGHHEMTKNLFAPINNFHQHLEFFNYHENKKVIAIEVGLQDINTIEGNT